eukprot:m.19430 g.19430  ORF g.19430 m.19430 type:complete len:343 (-) comp11829_c0_seq1:222-1250(-)
MLYPLSIIIAAAAVVQTTAKAVDRVNSGVAAPQAIWWQIGEVGETCDATCRRVRQQPCVEGNWPQSYQDFENILRVTGVQCQQVEPGGWTQNPQKDGWTCNWEGDGRNGDRCALQSSEGQQRFCPCANNPAPPPPSPPAPQPGIKWRLGGQQETCAETCQRLESSQCVEEHWPNSYQAFLAVESETRASCNSVQPGGWDENPRQDANGICYWEGTDGNQARCQYNSNNGNRFCPCSSASPTPPSPSVTWVQGEQDQSCIMACAASNMRCSEATWPRSMQEFQNIANKFSLQCGSIEPGMGYSYPANPERGGSGVCYWQGEGTGERCNLEPEPQHVRFCPCTK